MADNDPYAAYGGSAIAEEDKSSETASGDPYASYGGSSDAAPTDASTKPTSPSGPSIGWRDRVSNYIADPAINTPDAKGTWKGELERFGQGAAEGLINPVLHPVKTALSMGQQLAAGGASGSAMGVPATAMTGNRTVDAQNEQARADARASIGTQGRDMAANPSGALGNLAGGVLLSHSLGGLVKGITGAATPTPNAPGENFTPKQHASYSSVLARGNAGKGYFPKDVAKSIGSVVRQAAADDPALGEVAATGSPEESLAATQALQQNAIRDIDKAHAQALAPVANTRISARPIQNAVTFPSSLKDFAPEDAVAVQEFRSRLGKVNTLQGLNDLRVYLNTELQSMFKKNSVAANGGGALESGMKSALSATRDLYYQELEKATGQSFKKAKQVESHLLSAQEALGDAAPRLTARQAIAQQPRSARGLAADALQGAHTVSGSPVAGVARLAANKLLGETPMTPVQEGLHHFFSNLPEPTPQSVVQAINPGLRQLPAPAPLQLNPGAPQYVPHPQLQGSASPQLVAPVGQPQLGSGAGNPEFVTPPASYPSLNQATAALNPNAGTPKVQPEIIPPRTIQVNPEGQAAIQRPALPPPEEAHFSVKEWKKANPGGNAKSAAARARSRGYLVVD